MRLPRLVKLSDEQIQKADLMQELRIDRDNLDFQLSRQPQKYGHWSQLYATVSAKAEALEEKLDAVEARLFIRYSKTVGRVSDIRFFIKKNAKYRSVRKRLRLWRNAERHLKFAEKAFDQRLSALMALNANQRKEKEKSD